VKLVDVNILLYATNDQYPNHSIARKWLDDHLNGEEPLALPWETLLGFVRIAANPRLFRPCLTVMEAWTQVADWLASPCVWMPTETARHADFLEKIFSSTPMTSALVPDAQLAAFALEYGLTVVSADTDFQLFAGVGVRVENPFLQRK